MVELILISFLLIIFLKVDINKGTILFIAFLPFHAFIKRFLEFFHLGGSLFSFWKEAAIIIFIVKLLFSNNLTIRLNKKLLGIMVLFIGYVLYFFLILPDFKNGLGPLRNHIFTILLFIVFANAKYALNKVEKYIKYVFVSFFISYILGFVQLFWLKIPLGFLMGRIEVIDPSGHIIYTTNSATIHNFERMAGIIGGPNDFGLFIAISLLFVFAIRFSQYGNIINSRARLKLYILFLLGVVSLFFSFSRAGLAILFGGIVIMSYFFKVKISKKAMSSILTAFTILILIIAINANIVELLTNTFTGKEASSSDRINNIEAGFSGILKNPFGNGLGSTTNNGDGKVEFFVESASINMIYEIGIIGYFLLLSIYASIALKAYCSNKYNPMSSLGFSIVILTFLASYLSVNTYGMPYVLYSWAFMGLGVNPWIGSISKQLMHYNT